MSNIDHTHPHPHPHPHPHLTSTSHILMSNIDHPMTSNIIGSIPLGLNKIDHPKHISHPFHN